MSESVSGCLRFKGEESEKFEVDLVGEEILEAEASS